MGSSLQIGPVGPVAYDNAHASAPINLKVLEEVITKLNSGNAVGSDNEIVVTVSGHRLDIQVVNRDTREPIPIVR
jgi:hypothetical protein